MNNSKLEFSSLPNGGYQILAEMLVDQPIETVFSLFSDAFELQRITPPWLNFSVVTPPPIKMRTGLQLEYKLYLRHIPIRWRSEISNWEPPFRFVDQQIRGPYKRWHHEHTFESFGNSTLVRDIVHYVPRGGRLIHQWFVRPDLEKIFEFRQTTLATIFQEMSQTGLTEVS